MADYSEQINQLKEILSKEFAIQKKTGKIDHNVSAFWSKIKKVMPEELVASLESDPDGEDTKVALESELTRQFEHQRFIAHTAMFVNQYERKK
jgi:helix-turn-helix protein